MLGLSERYTQEMRRQFGYSATWLPTESPRVGDVGLLIDRNYRRIGCLSDFGIDYEVISSATQASLHYASSGSVTLTVKLSGSAPAPGSALTSIDEGLNLSFGDKHAVFFEASNCTSKVLANIVALEEQLIRRSQAGGWKADYVVVVEIVEAGCTTIVISASDNAVIELKANATANFGQTTLADASANLRIAQSRDIGTQLIAQGGLVPLFKAMGLKRNLLKGTRLAERNQITASSEVVSVGTAPLVLRELDYDDF